ncbi:MAG: hypothetical protein GH151_13590 [Bacteroidetes bacterium]|nr:hypothetical protein [Bacteroidota bacterium]
MLKNKKERVLKHRSRVKENPTNANIKFFETAIASEKKAASKVNELKKEFAIRDTKLKELKTKLKKAEKRYPVYGLSRKERQQQYKKKRTIVSSGYIRNKEADASKIEICDVLKIDTAEIYEEAMKNAEVMNLMKQLILYKKGLKAAALKTINCHLDYMSLII